MPKTQLSWTSHIARLADPSKVSSRIEFEPIDNHPEDDDPDQLPLYMVTTILEVETDA